MRRLSLISCGLALLCFGSVSSTGFAAKSFCPPTIASFSPVLSLEPTLAPPVPNVPEVESPFISPDGQYFTSTSFTGDVVIYDAAAQKVGSFNRGAEPMVHQGIDSQAKLVRTINLSGDVRTWDFAGNKVAEFRLTSGWLPSATFSPTGEQLVEVYEPGEETDEAVAFRDEAMERPVTREAIMELAAANMQPRQRDHRPRHIRILNAHTGTLAAELKPHVGEVRETEFSPDGSLLVTSTRAGVVRVERVADGKTIFEHDAAQKVKSVLSPDNQLLFVTGDKLSMVFRLSDSALMMKSLYSMNAGFVPGKENELVLHGWQNAVMHVRVQQTRIKGRAAPVIPLGYMARADEAVMATAVAPDGRLVAAEHSDGRILIYDLQTKLTLAELTGAEDLMGNWNYFTAGSRGYVRVNMEGALQYWDLSQIPSTAPQLQISKDGKLVVGTSTKDATPSAVAAPPTTP